MLITVRVFARLRDIIGASEIQREWPNGSTARVVWDTLVAEHPELNQYGAVVSTAINEEYTRIDHPLADGDEIAFLPPVSGG